VRLRVSIALSGANEAPVFATMEPGVSDPKVIIELQKQTAVAGAFS